MEYIKNDDGTFSIISETTEIVKLEDLEAQLENLEQLNEQANNFNAWVDTIPEDKKMFIQKQYFVIPEELRLKVEGLRKLK